MVYVVNKYLIGTNWETRDNWGRGQVGRFWRRDVLILNQRPIASMRGWLEGDRMQGLQTLISCNAQWRPLLWSPPPPHEVLITTTVAKFLVPDWEGIVIMTRTGFDCSDDDWFWTFNNVLAARIARISQLSSCCLRTVCRRYGPSGQAVRTALHSTNYTLPSSLAGRHVGPTFYSLRPLWSGYWNILPDIIIIRETTYIKGK